MSRTPLRAVGTLALAAALAACGGTPPPGGEATGAQPPTPPPRPAGHLEMVRLLAARAAEAREKNVYVGDGAARELRRALAELGAGASAAARVQLDLQLAEAELRLGNERQATARYDDATRLLPAAGAAVKRDGASHLAFQRGVAYLRLGETENCVHRMSPESCILPLAGGGLHQRPEGARQAMRDFEQVLGATLPDARLHLSALWLLNVAAMALGEYPQGVPERYRIPPAAWEPEAPFRRFANLAPRLGLATMSLAGGAVAEDFDGDGRLDLAVSTADPGGQLRLFHHRGDGTFEERTAAAGLTGITGGLNLVQADYDNDGDVDLLVLRGAWNFLDGRQPNSLLRNEGNGSWTDVTFDAGLGEVHEPTQTAAWADYDGDGDLDLYVGNESFEGGGDFPCQLFENAGDGTFTDVAARAGVENRRFAKSVVWGDYDDDGRPDLYVSNYRGANRLYRNRGDGTFEDVAPQLGVAEPIDSFPAWFWDYDDDGALDLYVSSYAATVADLAASYLGRPTPDALRPRLYRGDGHGGFTEVGRAVHLDRPAAPMGSNFADLDGDGALDLYLGTGWPEYEAVMPNLLYVQRGGRFADVTTASGLGHLQKGHAVVFADFDDDGDLDVFEQMGGFYRGDAFADAFYENPGFGHHWLGVELLGRRSNRSAIGARLRLEIDDAGTHRTLYRHVNSGGSFGGNPLRQTIGLGGATRVASLEIRWPAGGTVTFTDLAVDRRIRVVEGEEGFEVVKVEAVRLGGE